ncbi:chromate efflux transporter [Aliidiomarina indica]|uniref:chromate efflux transporter n=1 Tax=Aliidiomarina indica TaxID=2749147 RepID=UPI00188F4709|nr:chromate efflux transporter [Aliidiomarina indica]
MADSQVSFREALAVWWKIGLLSFGGPAGQIALMHRIIVEEKKWLNEDRFLHALNYCMLLPGPEAQQLATYVGWLLHGVKGGVVAGILFIIPGAAMILGLSWAYVLLTDVGAVAGLLFGLKAAVLAIVAQALVRLSRKALKTGLAAILALGGFLALFVFSIPFPVVVLAAAIIGWFFTNYDNKALADAPAVEPLYWPGTKRAALVCAVLWVGTIALLIGIWGDASVWTNIALFFSKLAVVTFGGAYAVLAYVAQQAVENYGWLQPGEMLDGLGLAETTPGPLILVTQFVGFLAGFRAETGLHPLAAATLAAFLTTWITFLPCFLWIFAGAPYVEKLRGMPRLSAALAAITAAVVGVIANLALWFALNYLFSERFTFETFGISVLLPQLSSVDLYAVGLTAVALILVFLLKFGIFRLLGIMAVAGLLVQWLGLSA